ncbi:MAG: IS1634 family transposase [Peptococcaceae bacterium]|nr:IS1634 family transposase [Peptococcaceae bacterium]
MFFRKVVSKSNGKEYTYVKLIENYREGSKVKQRVIANLGNIEDLTPEKVQGLITGLARICGLETEDTSFETKKVLHFGDVLALHKVWSRLGINKIIRDLTGPEKPAILPHLAEIMVMNQVLKPKNSKTLSDWYRSLYLPQLEGRNLTPEHFSRALDALTAIKEPLEKEIFQAVQNLFPAESGTVFCHLTRGFFERAAGETSGQRGTRSFIGRPPDRKQVDLSILVNEKGIPLGHRVFMGSFADGDTVPRRVSQIMDQYAVEKCIFVGDQKIITEENVRLLVAYGYEYIMGLELSYNRELGPLESHLEAPSEKFETIGDDLLYREIEAAGNRYLLCCNPEKAAENLFILENRLNSIEKELAEIQKWVESKCSFNAKANFYKAKNLLKDTFCRRYFEYTYDDKNNKFAYRRRQDVIDREIARSGKFVIKTNARDLSPVEIINAYTHYAEARDEFRLIKNIDTGPGDYTESRIRGYVFISVMAYLVEKALENILQQHNIEISARNALEILEDIKLTVNQMNHKEIRFVTPAHGIQKEILAALGVSEVPRTLIKGAVL